MAGPLKSGPAPDPDAIYQLLVEAHRDLSAEQSLEINGRLILLLANQIGDAAVIAAAVAAARQGVVPRRAARVQPGHDGLAGSGA